MRSASRLLLAVIVVAVSASCNGSYVSPMVVRDYRTGSPDHRVSPQSICIKRGNGWWCPPESSNPKPTPPPVYGSQGPCGAGYLYFSDGCEDIGTNVALYSGWQNWLNWPLSVNLAVIKFNDNHFWKQHLACVVAPSTNADVDGAITHDFNINHLQQPGIRPSARLQPLYLHSTVQMVHNIRSRTKFSTMVIYRRAR